MLAGYLYKTMNLSYLICGTESDKNAIDFAKTEKLFVIFILENYGAPRFIFDENKLKLGYKNNCNKYSFARIVRIAPIWFDRFRFTAIKLLHKFRGSFTFVSK